MPPLLAELNYIYAGIYNIIIITTEELHNRSCRFYNLYKHILTMTRRHARFVVDDDVNKKIDSEKNRFISTGADLLLLHKHVNNNTTFIDAGS